MLVFDTQRSKSNFQIGQKYYLFLIHLVKLFIKGKKLIQQSPDNLLVFFPKNSLRFF